MAVRLTDPPEPGQIAQVRQRLYLVEQAVPPKSSGDCTLVRLSCVDDDNQGQPLEVLWEREIDSHVLTGEAWDAIAQRGFDAPKLFAAYLNTLRWNCVTATNPRLFQSPFRAGIHLDAYQLEPLRKALLLPRVNLFIADDVGLGKTIEAGLIARELLLRKKVRDIVICCPPSMLLQWQDEMANRFGLAFEILDKAYVTRVRRERGFGVNPWDTHTRFLVSQRLLIDENYTNPLRDWLREFRPGSLLILDEAHHAAPASGQRYAIDSQITKTVREFAPCFEHRLFLSATPHNGHSNSFSALLELLDPQRFCRGVPVEQKQLDEVMVRRLKEDVRDIVGGLPVRVVEQININGLPADAPELSLTGLLDEYRKLREERLSGQTRRQQAAAGLLITGLQQRLLSSIEAFARTLRVHRRTVQRQWEEAQQGKSAAPTVPGQLDLLSEPVAGDDDRAALPEAELAAEEDAQFAAASAATAGPMRDSTAAALFAREQKLLDQMTSIAEDARARPDARVRKLVDWLRQHMLTGKRWTDLRILIFTEYDDTKRYLHEQLQAVIAGTDQANERIAIFHGPTPPDERERIRDAFNAPPAKHPLRILIATDAAREGLNLQAHCWNLFHFDVPWNPSRMEQRNGRIDRKLQNNTEVYCHYFVYQQRPEDRILAALVRKTEVIKRELGSLSQVIDVRLAETLKQGIRRDRIDWMEQEITAADLDPALRQTVENELEAVRLPSDAALGSSNAADERRKDLVRRQIDKLRELVEESKEHIGLDHEHFQSAISCALELLKAPPLKHQTVQAARQPSMQFPALDQLPGADPSWAETLDSLRAPRQREQKFWQWRKESPIRPIVFEDTGTLDDEVVHLHLEHRVVQRLLGRFTAQGFVHDDLSRACLAQTSDAIPRVVLWGRLCLYGPGAARLHEELVPVAARWTDPKDRKTSLTPYAREAETKTLELLKDSLLPQPGRGVQKIVQAKLQEVAPRDVQELRPHLDARCEQYAAEARQKLQDRGEAEAKAMRQILENQQKHIASTAARYAKTEAQLKLDFGDAPEEELRQLKANQRHWHDRLQRLARELESEPSRIRELYEIKAQRIEPIGLVYLWPVTG